MRVLVTGSRDWADYPTFTRGITVAIETLTAKLPDDRNIVLVHGGARGADEMCESYIDHTAQFLRGQGYTISTEIHRADWTKNGKAAGPIRNQEMIDLGADIVVAYIKNHSKGATHCATRARVAGIEVLEYRS